MLQASQRRKVLQSVVGDVGIGYVEELQLAKLAGNLHRLVGDPCAPHIQLLQLAPAPDGAYTQVGDLLRVKQVQVFDLTRGLQAQQAFVRYAGVGKVQALELSVCQQIQHLHVIDPGRAEIDGNHVASVVAMHAAAETG